MHSRESEQLLRVPISFELSAFFAWTIPFQHRFPFSFFALAHTESDGTLAHEAATHAGRSILRLPATLGDTIAADAAIDGRSTERGGLLATDPESLGGGRGR